VTQHLRPIHFRHFQIEQHDGGISCRTIRERPAAVKIVQRLSSIAQGDDLVRQAGVSKRIDRQLRVERTVVNK